MIGETFGCLIGITLNASLKPAIRTKLFRQLYGWRDKSQFGKYEYEREGLLSNIAHVRLIRGVFIVAQENRLKVKRFLKDKATVITREVVLTAKDKKILFTK